MEPYRKGDDKMKKFWALLCMAACVLGLSACGSKEQLTERQQTNLEMAKMWAVERVMPALEEFMADDNLLIGDYVLEDYTVEEIEYLIPAAYSFATGGYAFRGAVSSFRSARDAIGGIVGKPDVSSPDVEARIDGSRIIVTMPIQGEKKDAEAEIIFTNDIFLTLKSAALNPVSTIGDMMTKAALNTVIGMGTVFAVLILICYIISAFGLIAKMQKSASKKEAAASGIAGVAAQIERQEEMLDESDDLELVAVIAAAIAASEGAADASGFRVRSIRRRA